MKEIGFRKSIFIKLCTGFFIIILILFVMGYSIYNFGQKITMTQIIQSAETQNKNFCEVMNNEIKRIITLQYELSYNWDLTKLSLPIGQYNEYEKSLMILRVKDQISAIKTSSKLIDEINVIVPAIHKSIGTKTISEIPTSSLTLLYQYEDMEQKQMVYYNDELLLISEYPQVYYKRGLEPKFIICATLSQEAIYEFLNKMSLYNESNSFIFSQSRQMLIGGKEENKEIDRMVMEHVLEEMEIKSVQENSMDMNYMKSIKGKEYFITYSEIGVDDVVLVRYLPKNIAFGYLYKFKIIMLVFILVSIIVTIVFAKSLYNTIHNPLKNLVSAFDEVQNGCYEVTIQHEKNDEFKYIYESFNKMSTELHHLIEQVYKQKILVQKAELKQLQSQINPHFLYNSFLILNNHIEADDKTFATEFCRQLGSFFMFITRNSKDIVPLKHEVDHAITYCHIQQARFINRLVIELDPLPKEWEDIQVPRLILQPIFENAFEHTLENMDKNGYLHMGFEVSAGYLDIIIEDNGQGLTDEKIENLKKNLDKPNGEVTGMINIHKRLKLIYSHAFGLFLDRSQYGGLKVTIRVPNK